MSILFGRDVKTIGKHIANAIKEELKEDIPTVANFATVQNEGELATKVVVKEYLTTTLHRAFPAKSEPKQIGKNCLISRYW
jgi:hypothetical protein